jgi:rhamnogalacturonyl hydrolase YesR
MTWTNEQLAEALEIIDAIHKSTMATQRMLEETIASLRRMRETADRINAQIMPQMIDADAPSICPNQARNEGE